MIPFIKRKTRNFYHQFICLKGEPGKIAMGMAIGVFVGVTPTIPFHTVLIMVLIFIFRQNLTAALLGAWITNPVTMPVFYLVEYEIGRFFLGWDQHRLVLNDYSMESILKVGLEIFYPLLLGGLILAPFFAVPAYFITYRAVTAMRKKKTDGDCERDSQEI
ncbi:MAG: DUF2062 domain-containing protein [Syntrophales bacterium]